MSSFSGRSETNKCFFVGTRIIKFNPFHSLFVLFFGIYDFQWRFVYRFWTGRLVLGFVCSLGVGMDYFNSVIDVIDCFKSSRYDNLCYLRTIERPESNLSDFVKGLTVGGRVKILAAADRLDLRADNLNLRMSSDQWNVSTDASAMVALKGLDLAQLDDNSFDFSLNSGNLGLAGMGAAFDLGAEYRLYINRFFDSVRFSASVTDLGFINYYADAMQQFRTSGNVVYEGLDGISFGKDMDLGQTFDKIKDEFMKILDLEETVPQKNVLSRIRPNLYLGVEAPFLWNRMSLGLLYNAKFGYTSTRNELTLALNMRPGKWINIGVNYSMLNAAKSIGWLLEITPRNGVGFFLGSDYTYLETATLYTVPIGNRGINLNVPLNEVNFNLRFGCYITMGNRYDDIAMEKKARRAARRADRS